VIKINWINVYKIKSNLQTGSQDYKNNRKAFKPILQNYRSLLKNVQQGGGAIERHKERGKLLARERINLLLDSNTPFIELSSLAAHGMYNDEFPSAGIITGIGVVLGHETVLLQMMLPLKEEPILKKLSKSISVPSR
jgi:3-methylcrotonyl-CoA carboxylase beta subunit